MQDLIERLEKANGPDRELDGAIALSLGWTYQKMKGDKRAYYRKPGVTDCYLRATVPEYTSSLDAALTLVPVDLGWDAGQFGDISYATVWSDDRTCPQDRYQVEAASPAVALCIAALRAREHVGAQS